jgi:hypothetical protein
MSIGTTAAIARRKSVSLRLFMDVDLSTSIQKHSDLDFEIRFASNKIMPIARKGGESRDQVEFGSYLLLGLPEEFTKTIKDETDTLIQFSGQIAPTLLGVKSIPKPDDFPETKSRIVQ